MTEAAIELSDVSFRYATHPTLKNISLSVADGEFLGIVGPNGGGKTTLLRVILGLIRPDTGQVKVLGREPRAARNDIGYVPQFAAFERDFPISVRQVVMLGMLGRDRYLGRFGRAHRRAADQALERVGGAEWAGRPVSHLSGGELQRVTLARALVADPRILILDEPTAHVDPRAERSIFDLLADMHPRRTVLVVTHDVGFVSGYVGRVACVNTTLVCHHTEDLTGDRIAELYGEPVHMVQHTHVHPTGQDTVSRGAQSP